MGPPETATTNSVSKELPSERRALLTDVKVHQTSLSLSTPVSVSGDLEGTKGVGFLSDLALGLQI